MSEQLKLLYVIPITLCYSASTQSVFQEYYREPIQLLWPLYAL